MISSLTPEIIYEDKDIIVCHKPAGVPTQSSRIGTKDMVSILKNHLIKNTAKKTASHEPYLAVIHRLDQPVEGLLVFAKTPAAAAGRSISTPKRANFTALSAAIWGKSCARAFSTARTARPSG